MNGPGEHVAAGERLDDLRRGGLKVIQNPAAPCFAIDALLLADFCLPKPGDAVVELGTGTGVISLLLAVKQPTCAIRALELMPQMADMARRSVALNNLCERIEIIEGDMRQAGQMLGRGCCQTVVANPPYYARGRGRANAEPLFAAARSEVFCTIAELARESAALLAPGGQLCLVHRAARFSEVLSALLAEGLNPQIIRMVQPYAHKPANLFLLQAVKGGHGQTVLPPPLVVYEKPGVYTQEMTEIYG